MARLAHSLLLVMPLLLAVQVVTSAWWGRKATTTNATTDDTPINASLLANGTASSDGYRKDKSTLLSKYWRGGV